MLGAYTNLNWTFRSSASPEGFGNEGQTKYLSLGTLFHPTTTTYIIDFPSNWKFQSHIILLFFDISQNIHFLSITEIFYSPLANMATKTKLIIDTDPGMSLLQQYIFARRRQGSSDHAFIWLIM